MKNNKVEILVFGDFGSEDPSKIKLSQSLKRLINEQDIVGVNFEGSINYGHINSPNGKSVPQSDTSAAWLHNNGVNLYLLANNHIMDFGKDGLQKTLSTFNPSDLVIGAGIWEDAYKVHIVEINGVRIGLLNGTSCDFSALKSKWDDSIKMGCAWINSHEFTKKILQGVKECDALFIFSHAGVEYLNVPLPELRDLYRFWIDLGARGVIASHPHVPQGVESYKGYPIFYSLGNFIFEGTKKTTSTKPTFWRNSIAAKLTVGKESIEYGYIPILYSERENIVRIDRSAEIEKHIESLNALLKNDNQYMHVLDSEIPKFANKFEHFILSGWNSVIVEPSVKCLKTFLKAMLRNKRNNKVLLHQLREESTINTVIRNLKNKTNAYL